MKQPSILVIDIGTTLIKVSLFDFRCRLVDKVCGRQNEFSHETPFDAEACWREVATCSRQLAARNPACRIVVVGVTGFMHSVVALDRMGRPLPILVPAATVRECFEHMLTEIHFERIYEVTGSRLDTTSVPPWLMAFRRRSPNTFSEITAILPVKDFIRHRLTSEMATDEIDACGTMLYSVHHRRWDADLISYCGLREGMLPPILHCTSRGGTVTPAVAEALHIPAGIPVSVGGGDDIEIIGCGALGDQAICEHVGSTGSFLMHTQTASPDPKFRLELYPAVDAGKWVLGGSCSNVTRALDWFLKHSVYTRDGGVDWNRVQGDLPVALGRLDSDRPLFLPYVHGERAPFWNPDLTAKWLWLRNCHTSADLLLSVIEGVCFSLRSIFDVYKELGIQIDSICSSGGLNDIDAARLRATVYGTTIRQLKCADPTSFAAAAIALCSIGELSDPQEAAAWLEFEPEIEPMPEWEALLDQRFELFSEATAEMLAKPRGLNRKQSGNRQDWDC